MCFKKQKVFFVKNSRYLFIVLQWVEIAKSFLNVIYPLRFRLKFLFYILAIQEEKRGIKGF